MQRERLQLALERILRTSGSFLKNFVLLFYQASIQILGLWQVCLVTKGVMLNFSCTIVLSKLFSSIL